MMEPRIISGNPALVLAPMEGVTDAPMRAFLTERGGFSFCVSEFFRVSQDLPRAGAFAHHVPELKSGARTPAGTPVQVQLLGGNAERLAESARRACQAGAQAIDLNFGCPAPTVNRNDGGASLLREPRRIREIVGAVRTALGPLVPLSAKLRLGWDSIDPIHENADMAAEGGVDWITIHGRTKIQGYRPPAHWRPIGEVRRRLGIPVVANGEIFTLDDLRRCRDATGCEHFMIGRGALADLSLPLALARELGIAKPNRSPNNTRDDDWAGAFARFAEYCHPHGVTNHYALCRIKQWTRMASATRKLAFADSLKRADSLDSLFQVMRAAGCSNGLSASPRMR